MCLSGFFSFSWCDTGGNDPRIDLAWVGHDLTKDLALITKRLGEIVKTLENLQKNCPKQYKPSTKFPCHWMHLGTLVNLIQEQCLVNLELEIPVTVVAPPHPAQDENLPQVVRKKLMGMTWGNTSLILVPGWQGYEIIYQPHTRAYLVQTKCWAGITNLARHQPGISWASELEPLRVSHWVIHCLKTRSPVLTCVRTGWWQAVKFLKSKNSETRLRSDP